MFKKLSRKSVYKDAWIELFQDEIELPNGSKSTYAWVNRKSGVSVVVVTRDKKILLHREYRYVIDGYSWEIQGGGIDDAETPEQAAVRELQEEAGILVEAGALQPLGVFYPLHSFNTETVTLFWVMVDEQQVGTQGMEAAELITQQQFFTFDQVLEMIDTGEINDAMTAHAVQMVIRRVGG